MIIMIMYILIHFKKLSRHYNKYSARKRDESFIPAATYKLKVKDKPKEKEIGNKRPRNSINL